jgi:hypothetical protein
MKYEVSTNHNRFRKSSTSHVLMFLLILNSAIQAFNHGPGIAIMSYHLGIYWPRIKGGTQSSFHMIIRPLSPSPDTYLALSPVWFMNLQISSSLLKLYNIHKCQHDLEFMIEKADFIYQISIDFQSEYCRFSCTVTIQTVSLKMWQIEKTD